MKAMRSHSIGRRRLLQGIALGLGAASMRGLNAQASSKGPVALKPVPSTGETLPVIGLGTWITFNVGNDRAARFYEVYLVVVEVKGIDARKKIN